MRYVLHHVGALLAFGWILFVPGVGLDALGARRGLWPGGDVLVRFVLGIGAWVVVLFAAAALGLLEPRAFQVLAALVASGGAVWAFRRRRRPRWQLPPRRALVALVPFAALLWVLGHVFLLAIRPTLEWDADTYHLTLPRLYLEAGGFRPVRLNVYSNWPLAVDLLFALGLMLDDHVTATTLHFGLGVLTALGVHRYVRRHGPPWAALAGAAFFLGTGLVQVEMGIAYVELGMAFFFLQACVWLIASFEDPAHERGWLLLTGVACGLLAGTKHTGLFGGVAIAVVYAAHHLSRAGSAAAGVRALGRGLRDVALPAFLLALPWYVKSFWYTGNPVYPFLYEVFGGVDWSAELSRQHAAWHASYGVGSGWRQLLQLPLIVFSSRAAAHPRFFGTLEPMWTVLVPLALVLCFRRRAIAFPLLAAAVFFWLWAFSSQQMRFLVAILPLLAAAAALALARAVDALPRRPAWLGGLVALVALALMVASVEPRLADARRWLWRYRHEGAAVMQSAVHPRWRALERLVPADGKLLFLNSNHGFFCPRPYLADSFFEASQVIELLRPYESVEALHEFLRRSGITHVLHHPPFRGMVYPDAVPALLEDGSRMAPIYRSGDGFTLYEVR
jgi:hypothetical protein